MKGPKARMIRRSKKDWFFFTGIVSLILILDLGSKFFLIPYLASSNKELVLTSFFNLVMVWNYGVSFGTFPIFAKWGIFLWSGLAFLLSAVLVFWGATQSSRLLWVALALVVGGALGNAIDRLLHGAVADFFDFHIAGYHWPAFNVADIAISFGACLIIIEAFLKRDEGSL